jgi:uncharacterized protein YegL
MKNEDTSKPQETLNQQGTSKKKTYYHLVLDRSGSMNSCWQEATQVINRQIKDLNRIQSENPDTAIIFSLCAFNQALRFSEELMNVETVKIDWTTIYPDGMTALFDAVGKSIEFVKEKAGEGLNENDSDVVMLVLTDGHENASKTHSGMDVKEMIQACERTEKWNFLFLGAGLDVSEVTRDLDRGKRNSMSFEKSKMASAMGMVSEELSEFVKSKNSGKKKKDFFEGDEFSF